MSDLSRLHQIPSISSIIENKQVKLASGTIADEHLVEVARRCQSDIRTGIVAGLPIDPSEVIDKVLHEIKLLSGQYRGVTINGTGVIVHTNLGRAPVSAVTAEAMRLVSSNYLPLEVDPMTGDRGGRGLEIESLFRTLTGAERTLVVNNNAAAITLTLAALADGKEVVVSRGEAVEIGGGFRIPDVIEQSGAKLVEVGTTNRTYASDYASAITERTAALLKVHHSNFEITGFTSMPSVAEITETAHQYGVYSIEDVGSGCLIDTQQFGLRFEPTLKESIQAGVDVVTASGDKLLGGPQAGIILGKNDVVDRIARHPLARAVRADKTTLAGIAATLRHYLAGNAVDQIPVWWCISRELGWLATRTRKWQLAISDERFTTIGTQSVVGGGSLPGRTLPSQALRIDTGESSTVEMARILRTGNPSVFPRIEEKSILIDARTVLPDQDELLLLALRNAIGLMGSSS